ncbi:molecular chaperone [Vibrio sp. FNV 38]|nr:molecular chaperone [Vibrio sp. FNV 38]
MHCFNRLKTKPFLHLFLLSTLLVAQVSHAALALDRTRLIFNQTSDLEVLQVRNPIDLPFLAQSWISSRDHELNEDEELLPFLVVPPVTRIEGFDYAAIRIQRLSESESLPDDRESVFYFHLREIPPKPSEALGPVNDISANGSIQLAFESVIKMFYRPNSIAKIKNVDYEVAQNLSIEQKASSSTLHNHSPFHVTVFAIQDLDDEDIHSINSFMVSPFSTIDIELPKREGYKITTINDYGAQVSNQYNCANDQCRFTNFQ